MKRGHAKKVSAIFVGVILSIFCVISFSSLQTTSTAYAQSQTIGVEQDKIKSLLLRPGGWEGDWRGPGGSGEEVILFESRGEKIVAKITVGSGPKGYYCVREVVISSDIVNFDGCRDSGIMLQFDPNDIIYPFKSKTKSVNGFEYKLKAK
jgi:hypothetical protein